MLEVTESQSIFEIISAIVSNSKVLWFEIVGDYSAIRKFETFAQVELGERGHGNAKSMMISNKIVSGCGTGDYKPDNIIVTMKRDASTRTENGEYDATTRIVASLSEKQRIHAVKVSFRGEKGFQTINLRNRFMFPELNQEEKNFLAEELFELRALEEKINGADRRITALKKQTKEESCNGLKYAYKAPEGQIETLCNAETGEPVKRENKTIQENGVCLVPCLLEKYEGYKKTDVSDLPMLVWERNQMKETYKERIQNVRWMELSVIERMASDQTITVFGQNAIEFEIVRSKNTVYDYTPEVVKGIEEKKYVKMPFPKSRGEWILTGTPEKVYSVLEVIHA